MKYHTLLFFRKLGKMSQNLSSAAGVIGALKVKWFTVDYRDPQHHSEWRLVFQGRLRVRQVEPSGEDLFWPV